MADKEQKELSQESVVEGESVELLDEIAVATGLRETDEGYDVAKRGIGEYR